MNHNKNFKRVIALMLILAAVFTQPYINAQSLNATDGITINYIWTIGNMDKVELSTMTPMHFFGRKSIFLTNPQEASAEYENDEAGKMMSVNIRPSTKDGQAYFIDRNTKKIMAQELILDETANVEESIPDFVWQMTGEIKEIAEHNCYEATTLFRGRSYSAWFAPDIPLNIGPWKFSGLPGAILQVNDKEGRFNWYCKSISVLSLEDKKLIQVPENKKLYSFKEYQDLFAEKLMDHLNKMLSGANVNIISEPNFDSWLERKPD